METSVRTLNQRIADTRAAIEREVDLWVATSNGANPYLVPLSYGWDGATFLLSTPAASVTGRNLAGGKIVRLGLGPARDVILIEATAFALQPDELEPGEGDAFALRTGFDPREEPNDYHYYRLTPQRIQAWRGANELQGRDLMRNGSWLA